MGTPAKGLRQFVGDMQQHAWREGKATLRDSEDRAEFLEQRFNYAARFEKLLRRPQVEDVLDILRLYGATCLPIPRTTERFYWSVSCLPSTNDKPLVRVNASWMELFTLLPDDSSPLVGDARGSSVRRTELRMSPGHPILAHGGGPAASAAEKTHRSPPPNPPHKPVLSDAGGGVEGGEGLRARIILHLADFTSDGSPEPDHLDHDLLESCVERPEDIAHSIWNGKAILIAKVRGAASIRQFLAHPHALRAIRNFNLTHLNRGRNAYQASHCYSVADVMLGD